MKHIEEWRDVAEYEGLYQISSEGRVKSLYDGRHKIFREKILKPFKEGCGYLKVTLYKGGKRKMFKVHRLVANAFLKNPLSLPQVNHKDENKENNFVLIDEFGKVDETKSNLEWCSREYNNNYGTRNKRVAEANSKVVIQFSKDLVFIREFPSLSEVARKLGYAQSNISECCNCKRKTAYGYIWRYK